ncbi:hypothetical protein AJ79_03940 [Helicocarpus griseus UAMH5409]|uniref:histone acetyltransferase n=1 Tax=Helicocarpus griseus UAMH5409 TaxID=1447875 RepID=A0A2B7XWT4_9EURO|nr:hypothetical protein AJ79_03940 [Helicocarpus griseus UAMH5409]
MRSPSLRTTIAQAIPKDVKLTIRHLVTSPTSCPPLFASPPGQNDEPTSCEHHFLTVSIHPDAPVESNGNNGAELFIFGAEVLVFNTANLTTVFVSKADSTGYLYRLKLPPTAKSLMRSISTTFLSHVVSSRQRPGVRLVLSLFARAQNQYLFPGSVQNSHKHILDDRGLIKWWCRAVDPILRGYEPEVKTDGGGQIKDQKDRDTEVKTASASAYVIVPGCDKFESRTFFPPTAKSDPQDRPRWLNSYPVRQICGSQAAPPRCQIPRFPDDPKARFLTDLDDEIPDIANETSSGQWRSIKTIDQFWEMMAFRQECSSGRLVGFLWVVINPPGLLNSVPMASSSSQNTEDQHSLGLESKSVDKVLSKEIGESLVSDTKPTEPRGDSCGNPQYKQNESSVSSQPQDISANKNNQMYPANTQPENDDGTIILSNESYQHLMNLLVELDFDNEEAAIKSSDSWVSKLSTIIGRSDHGETIVGEYQYSEASTQQPSGASNLLSGGLIRKRKKDSGDTEAPSGDSGTGSNTPSAAEAATGKGHDGAQITTPTINVLNASMIRKKKKKQDES